MPMVKGGQGPHVTIPFVNEQLVCESHSPLLIVHGSTETKIIEMRNQ